MRMGGEVCRHCGKAKLAGMLGGLCDSCLLRASMLIPPAEGAVVSQRFPAMEVDFPLSAGRRLFGDFEILEQIGCGGMGVVFKARQISLDRVVAVKLVRGGQLARLSDVRRFQAEGLAVARLRHPNIVTLFEAGERLGQPYIAMEFVDGAELGVAARSGQLSFLRAAEVMARVADAVQHAHSQGVLHRDLKPSNVLLTAAGEPRVTDFGLATAIGSEGGHTATGALVGSPAYISPEQAAGRHKAVGPRSDVYSLGATLYEVLTGAAPYRGESALVILQRAQEGELSPPRKIRLSVPVDLETICLKCLEKDPAARYGTAREVADELERFVRGEPVHAHPVGVLGKVRRWGIRQPALNTTTKMFAYIFDAV